MSADPSLIADLIRAGVDADLVQRVALELGRASAEREAIETRRQADRERQALRRGHVMSRDVTLQPVTTRDVTAAPNGPTPLPPGTVAEPALCGPPVVWAGKSPRSQLLRRPCHCAPLYSTSLHPQPE